MISVPQDLTGGVVEIENNKFLAIRNKKELRLFLVRDGKLISSKELIQFITKEST